MTPRKLLNSVKASFPILLHDDQMVLDNTLRQALGFYQDKAGVTLTAELEQLEPGVYKVPEGVLVEQGCSDSAGAYVVATRTSQGYRIDDNPDRSPYTLTYLASLRDIDLERAELPPTIITDLYSYLRVLIEIPNTEALRQALLDSGQDASQYPDGQSLEDRKAALEETIKSSAAFLAVFSIR